MNSEYSIKLDGVLIGTTEFEKHDAPMGVVLGKINFKDKEIGYNFIKDYCQKNNLELAFDEPDDKVISTMTMENLKVTNNNETEIKGVGNQITGMDSDEYEISIFGIAYPFYEEEFPHHVRDYENMFNSDGKNDAQQYL